MYVALRDVYENESELPILVKFIGPDFDYMLEAAAKGLDGREGNTIDGETITNAASVQIELTIGMVKMLLTGDCSPEAISSEEALEKYTHIQLPHHGKSVLAEKIFDCVGDNNDIIYIVSDNTGNSNGGSDTLNAKGKNVKNTKNIGNINISTNNSHTSYTGRTLGL